ncbi:hypothetical protein [Amycolatopsis sp. NPDC051102]|uniref:hypothetical protein n=1 Tax=Amycolatopsis sp. NPDC051102 TaxID=3155163 RepID=UPI00342B97AA
MEIELLPPSAGRAVVELLMPWEWTHPAKQFLAERYGRLGYRVTHRADFADGYPRLAPALAAPCAFLIHRKDRR